MSQHEITDVNHNTNMCMMQAAAFLARLTGSTPPDCVCPVLASFVVRLNDELGNMIDGDGLRFRNLHTFAPMLVDSKSTPEVEVKRALVLVHWAVQTFTPIAMHRAGMSEQAARFNMLGSVINSRTAAAAARVSDWAAACAAGRKDEVAWSVARAVSRAAENAEKACTRTDEAAAQAAARDAARAAAVAAALIYEPNKDSVRYAFEAALEVTA